MQRIAETHCIAKDLMLAIKNELECKILFPGFDRLIIAAKRENLSVIFDSSQAGTDYQKVFSAAIENLGKDMAYGVVKVSNDHAENRKTWLYRIGTVDAALMIAVSRENVQSERSERFLEDVIKDYLARMLGTSMRIAFPPAIRSWVLTPRQMECLKWVARGKSDWEIAQLIQLSPHTVHRHIEAAKKRLNVATRVQAVVEAGLTLLD